MNNRFYDEISFTTPIWLVHEVIENMRLRYYLLPNLFLVPIIQTGFKLELKNWG